MNVKRFATTVGLVLVALALVPLVRGFESNKSTIR
jgi:hypothetical protein